MTSASPSVRAPQAAILECSDITKSFGGVPVLRGITLNLEPGTVTALAGENGAGKSTLMKIVSGQYSADSGDVTVQGTHLAPGNPRDAVRHGVAIVPQELASIEDMTVYENLFVGRELKRGPFLNRRAMIDEAKETLSAFDVAISPTARMGSLPVGLRQIVEIVKAARTGAQVVMLDEPTSAISEREVEGLYGIVRRLRDHGVAMVYTTHKMAEIRAIADRVVVLRDGGLILDEPLTNVTDDDIVTAMIGRELDALFPARIEPKAEAVLEVRDLQVDGASRPVSFSVRSGEILGLAGLVGAGRTELLEAIFGARHTSSGEIVVRGRSVKRNSPAAAIADGMAMVPEDRKISGVVLSMSVLDNGSLPRLSAFSVAGWLRSKARTTAVSDVMESVRLRSSGLGQQVGTLSGGNQQKVVLARWLTGDVNVLLLDEPTRGVDVGARQRDLPHHHRIRRGRHGGGDGVVGHARDHRSVAPGVRHARRRAGRRTRPRRTRPPGRPGIRVPDGDRTRRAPAPREPINPHGRRSARVTGGSIVTTQLDTEGGQEGSKTVVASPTTGEPVRLFSREWLSGMALRYSMVIIMLLVIAYFSYRSARFGTVDNLVTILVAAAPFALIALGQTLVVLTGGIDLSVGSVIAVSAMAGAATAKANPGQVWMTVLVAMVVGLAVGSVNGILVSRINVPPFIATLGTLTAGSGLAYVIGGGAPINGLPAEFGSIANTKILGLQIPVLVMIIGIIVLMVVMRRTTYGMRVYAVGGNRNAAEIAGINAKNVLFSVYALSGLLAGISGVMLASRVISGPPNLGQGYELDAIAAVVIGGASLMGGRGTIWGTVLGLFIIQTLNNGLDILVVPAYWQDVIKGVLIVAAVAVDVWSTRRRT
jgi:ribose transport system ATP-binding protein